MKFNFELAAKLLLDKKPNRNDVAQFITDCRGLYGEALNWEDRCLAKEKRVAILEQENIFLCSLIGEKNV